MTAPCAAAHQHNTTHLGEAEGHLNSNVVFWCQAPRYAPSVSARTIVITGASDGIGAAAARRLSHNDENVVVVGRSRSKTTAVAAELGADYFVADFADLWQVRALADKIRSQYPRIDVLVNNAGGMTNKPYLTADGYEITYQVNYLAPFLLTTQLLDLLVESRASVINTSSGAHKWVRNIAIADFENTLRRRPIVAYAISKLANILFTRELHRRYHPDGLSVAAVHPGVVATNFSRASGSQVFALLEKLSLPRLFATAEQGAAPLAWLASSTPGIDWQPGEYYAKSEIAKASRTACDRHLASDLWDRTLATIGHL